MCGPRMYNRVLAIGLPIGIEVAPAGTLSHLVVGGKGRRFGRTVYVDQTRRGARVEHATECGRVGDLSADKEGLRPCERVGLRVGCLMKQCRRQEHRGHTALGNRRGEAVRAQDGLVLEYLEPSAVEQRSPESRTSRRRTPRWIPGAITVDDENGR